MGHDAPESETSEIHAAAGDKVQRHRHPQPWQVRPGERQVGRCRQVHTPSGRQHPAAFAQVERGVGHMLNDGMREDEVETVRAERQGHAVGTGEAQVRQLSLSREPDAGLAEPIDGVDADDQARMLGERQRHAAAAASGVEDAAVDGDASALEEREHLRAAVVSNSVQWVLGSEASVGVCLDEVVSNLAHARARRRETCR